MKNSLTEPVFILNRGAPWAGTERTPWKRISKAEAKQTLRAKGKTGARPQAPGGSGLSVHFCAEKGQRLPMHWLLRLL